MAKAKKNKPTNPINIHALNRRNFAVELRTRGMTYRQIAEEVRNPKNAEEKEYNVWDSYGAREAWRDVREELDNTTREMRETVEEFIDLELKRLDLVTREVYAILENPDESAKTKLMAASTVLKSQERRAKLLGLDQPTKVQSVSWRDEIIELYKLGKITIEQIRKELPDEFAREVIAELPKPRGETAIELREVEDGSWSLPDESMEAVQSSRT